MAMSGLCFSMAYQLTNHMEFMTETRGLPLIIGPAALRESGRFQDMANERLAARS